MAGISKGHNWIDGGSGSGHNPLFAGRIEYNFLDPEPSSAYYTASTYYGKADILAIGLAGQYQVNGVGSALQKGDYKAWNVDGLFEKRIGTKARYGVYTLEAAYYQYRTAGVLDIAPSFNNHKADYGNIGGINSGTAFLASTAYLIPWRVGWGRIQPLLRYQQFRLAHDLYGPGNPKTRQFDAGANYMMDGHNLRFTFDFARYTPVSGTQSNAPGYAGLAVRFDPLPGFGIMQGALWTPEGGVESDNEVKETLDVLEKQRSSLHDAETSAHCAPAH